MEHGDTLQYAYRRSCQNCEQGINAAGGKAIIFGTITVSDGISMGTPGMRYSLFQGSYR